MKIFLIIAALRQKHPMPSAKKNYVIYGTMARRFLGLRLTGDMDNMLIIPLNAVKMAVWNDFERTYITKVLINVKNMIIFEIDVDFWKEE